MWKQGHIILHILVVSRYIEARIQCMREWIRAELDCRYQHVRQENETKQKSNILVIMQDYPY